MAPRLQALAAAAALAAGLPARPARAQVVGAAARVNGAEISNERLERFFETYAAGKGRQVASFRSPEAYRRWKREALDVLIDEELLWQESQRRGIRVSPRDVDAAVAAEQARFPAPGALSRELQRNGISEAGLPAFLRRQLSIERFLRVEIADRQAVTGAEVRRFQIENPERSRIPERVSETRAAEDARRQLLAEKTRRAVRERLDALRREARVEVLVPL